MKLLFGMLMTFLACNLSAEEALKLIKVKELGPMKNKVIFQSSDVKKIKKTNLVKGKLVVQWGLHVYEVVNGFYSCNAKKVCRLTDYERVATYESCKVIRKNVTCKGKIAGDSSSNFNSDLILQENPDEISDPLSGSVINDGPDSTEDDSRSSEDTGSTWPVF